jgi:hypothetical protein
MLAKGDAGAVDPVVATIVCEDGVGVAAVVAAAVVAAAVVAVVAAAFVAAAVGVVVGVVVDATCACAAPIARLPTSAAPRANEAAAASERGAMDLPTLID